MSLPMSEGLIPKEGFQLCMCGHVLEEHKVADKRIYLLTSGTAVKSAELRISYKCKLAGCKCAGFRNSRSCQLPRRTVLGLYDIGYYVYIDWWDYVVKRAMEQGG